MPDRHGYNMPLGPRLGVCGALPSALRIEDSPIAPLPLAVCASLWQRARFGLSASEEAKMHTHYRGGLPDTPPHLVI